MGIVSIFLQLYSTFICLDQITVEAMKSNDDNVCLQGIEFWSNVCDEELDLSIEMAEVCNWFLHHIILREGQKNLSGHTYGYHSDFGCGSLL